MENHTNILPIHKNNGTINNQKDIKALEVDYALVDDRSLQELIINTNKLSNHINFFNNNNIKTGNWSHFFQSNVQSALAEIFLLDIEMYQKQFQILKRELIFITDIASQQNSVLPFINQFSKDILKIVKSGKSISNDITVKEYFSTSSSIIISLLNAINLEINNSNDLNFSLQNHLLTNKLKSLFGLLNEWKLKSSEAFLDVLQNYSKHTPHYALYLAFLQLYKVAQDQLNTITKKHLNFYYQKVLQLQPKKALPDYAHLIIEPNKNTEVFSIPKNSVFLGGKDNKGNNKYYKNQTDVAINKAIVSSLYSAVKTADTIYFNDLLENNKSGESWDIFPKTSNANLGFAIASPLLYMQNGDRTIELRFLKSNAQLSDFKFYITSEKEWKHIESSEDKLTINADKDKIINYDSEIHKDTKLSTKYPVLKIIPKNSHSNFSFDSIKITITVNNLKSYKLIGPLGEIDTTKPFKPFTDFPQNGMALQFICNEFFQKNAAEGNGTFIIDSSLNLDGKTKIQMLNNGKWEDSDSKDLSSIPLGESKIYSTNIEDEVLNNFTKNGALRIVLNSNDYLGNKFMKDYLNQVKAETISELTAPISINNFQFNYTITETLKLSSDANQELDFFHLYPKGYQKIKKNESLTISPNINSNGELIIGFKNLELGNSLNVLFQMLEGSANPTLESLPLSWKILNGNSWEDISTITDHTNNLIQSGIVNFQVPQVLDLENQTIFSNDKIWVKVSTTHNLEAICNCIGLHPQALKVALYDYEKSNLQFTENTPAKTISKLLLPIIPSIKKIHQVYDSFNGRAIEQESAYQLSCAERLRHKEKGITKWDYERLILDQFPEVSQVKCLNHYRYDSHLRNNLSAGYVTIIPIANRIHKSSSKYWSPLVDLGTMKSIESFIRKKISPHVRLKVKTPVLEEIQLLFKIEFKTFEGADTLFFENEIKGYLNNYLSPWVKNQHMNIDFSREISSAEIIKIIDSLPYVDFISELEIKKRIFNSEEDFKSVKRITPSSELSLFIPSEIKISSKNCSL